jgi:hypothetical protein
MKRTSTMLAIAGLSLMGVSAANAGFSTISPSSNPSEPDQAAILSHIYGGTFTASGVDFTNGSLTATRLDDDTDTSFSGPITAPTTYETHTSLDVSLAFDGSKYVLSRNGGIQFTSDPADNFDGKDHQITYLVTGPGVSGYALFFEDTKLINTDFDFNDVVIASIPLPAALGSGLASMAAMGAGMLIRRARKTA